MGSRSDAARRPADHRRGRRRGRPRCGVSRPGRRLIERGAHRLRRRHTQRASATDADPASPYADPDAAIWVRDALATLDDGDREVLMLREYEQLSYQEIADLRGIPLNTVRSRLFRARQALKEALDRRTPEATRTTNALR